MKTISETFILEYFKYFIWIRLLSNFTKFRYEGNKSFPIIWLFSLYKKTFFVKIIDIFFYLIKISHLLKVRIKKNLESDVFFWKLNKFYRCKLHDKLCKSFARWMRERKMNLSRTYSLSCWRKMKIETHFTGGHKATQKKESVNNEAVMETPVLLYHISCQCANWVAHLLCKNAHSDYFKWENASVKKIGCYMDEFNEDFRKDARSKTMIRRDCKKNGAIFIYHQ